MNDLKEAYERLGLPDTATKEEVEKRYTLLLRQSRASQTQQDDAAGGGFSEVTKAYRTILEAENRKAVEDINQQQYGKYKRFAGTAEKVDHFFSYYKFHVIGAIAVIAIIIYGVNTYMDNKAEQERLASLPPAALTASLFGEFYMEDGSQQTEPLNEALLAQFPEWERVETSILNFSMDARSEMDIAMQQKAVIQLATEDPDVYIMDRSIFDWMVRNDILASLDEYASGAWSELLPEGAALKAATQDNPTEHVYGIALGSSPMTKQLPLHMKEFIVGIRIDAGNKDNALHLIETYLQAGQSSAD
ncbi:J domain-containing protein [Paenibacillus sambharensis]|uniref:J domain-containing protein n=1 Tax=Paenibacillus sambharensis TaxID=1803190 RepID=A0A2W1LBC9_9BACL|nr:J domain-containing protein [Paenibacillus sambharensis]PZD95430.1 J domain-containing protein [Paenibacillus sambharensis]